MVKSESSKRLMASKGSRVEIGKIADLPDDLISNILSFLPTKDAVRTSVLSTRWKLLWTCITSVDFDVGEAYAAAAKSSEARLMWARKFTKFVKMVLPQLNPLCIQNFQLTYYRDFRYQDYQYRDNRGTDIICPKVWISEAFQRTSQQLVLHLVLVGHLMLPLSHTTYCNLAVLKLEGCIHFYVPAKASVCFPRLHILHLNRVLFVTHSDSSVRFPNLKKLHLETMQFVSEDFVNKLISSSPVLDYLVFKRHYNDNRSCIRICIPSLTRLTLHLKGHSSKVEINTPALEYLHVNDTFGCEYLPMENFSTLREVEFVIDKNSSFVKYIGCLSNVKFLSGSGQYFLEAFRLASSNISLRFYNLARLELKKHLCTDLSVEINNLLESMENLEHIVIKEWLCNCSHQTRWLKPLNVPKCLLSRLTTVSFDFEQFNCYDSIELLRYLMKNGEVLQLVNICNLPFTKLGFEILKKIVMFPRASKTCQVAFTKVQ